MNHGDTEAQRKSLNELSGKVIGLCIEIHRELGPGKRHLSGEIKQWRSAAEKAREFRQNFLRMIKPDHPLYHSREARLARGEETEAPQAG
jgi:hypothetical protein